MARITVYRTDSREFEPDREMTSAGDHRDGLPDEETREAEDAIRLGRADAAEIRIKGLYVYTDAGLAQRDWEGIRNKGGKRHFYKLEVDEKDTLHKGDLMIYAEVVADVRARRDKTVNVQRYWDTPPAKGRNTEYLVRKAIVVEKLKDAAEWKSSIQRSNERLRDDPENEDFYKSLFRDDDQD